MAKRLAPYLVLFIVSFAFWYPGNRLRGVQGLLDQATRAISRSRTSAGATTSASHPPRGIGLGVLMYAAGGGRQLGFRYFIDLLPIGFLSLVLAGRRSTPAMALALAVSLGLNLYGLATWKELTRAG